MIDILGCGISLAKQTAQRRIVGGDDAGFGNFPWQSYIRIGSSRYDIALCNNCSAYLHFYLFFLFIFVKVQKYVL
jgi:hypothetical protein